MLRPLFCSRKLVPFAFGFGGRRWDGGCVGEGAVKEEEAVGNICVGGVGEETMRLPSPDGSCVVSKFFSPSTISGLPPSEKTAFSIFIRIAPAKFGVIGLGRGAGDTCPPSAVPSRTTPGMGVYDIDVDFDKVGHTNPFPTADDNEPDEDPKRRGSLG